MSQLEAKLEDLVSLLRRQAAPSADKALSPSDAAGSLPASTPTLSTHSTASQTADSSPPSGDLTVLPPQQVDCVPGSAPVARGSLLASVFDPQDTAPLAPQTEPSWCSSPSFALEPSPVEAAENLTTFRKYMLTFFPFVHIPATMTSEKLKETYPFLWYNIMTVTCKNVDRRLAMGETLKKVLGQKMLMDQEKSLDLLLGLIVMLTWTHFHLKKEKPILSLLASLAKSLVFDLGLNKIPSEPISYSIKRLDALSWTSHMDECLQVLSQQREWEGDDLLVAQVKVQLIVEELARVTSQSPDAIPASYVLSALRSQLQKIKAQLPPHLRHNDAILSHISYTELAINEVAIAKPKASSDGVLSSMQRYEAMEASLSAANDWLDRHFSIPTYVYIGMTFSYWWNMAHCLLTIYRLSVLDDPAWDRRAVRKKTDLLAICDKLRAGFEEVLAQRCPGQESTIEEDAFSKFVRLMRTLKNNWAPELVAAEGQPGPSSAAPAEALVESSNDGLNVPLFQPDDSDIWFAGLFDMNWGF
ncbi:2996b653-1133-4681-aa8e-47aec6c8f710 [Thermothielavioides terrestris]|uniref:2996b653-1133-4681-aa8e-47aec6c8f710 n=1 Tax=Thermothielavioides terrestris TaxID=2587410 RepID=A0A446BWD8_9PEZI|nr:2996b653-1133-4681-aa8e-47aec6c8f710 [Thermothielavioides terrestris]